MAMLYYVTLAIGGTMVVVSLVLGGEHDHDAGADADADLDVDGDADGHIEGDHGGAIDAVDAWLPITSLRFWTFFAAFFGLTGTLLTSLHLGGTELTVGLLAGGMGYLSGVAVTRVIRRLKEDVVDSSVLKDDWVGEEALVMLPFGNDREGKVRMTIKGRVVEALATTDEDTEFKQDETAFVYGVNDDGVVLVSRMKRLES